MKLYKEEIVSKVRDRRKQGISLRKLGKEFSIPNTTISRWVRDIDTNDLNFQRARNRVVQNKAEFSRTAKGLRVTKVLARVLAGLLYWCEGSKYPASNSLAFSNSDWTLVKTFLELLRKGFDIDDKRLRLHLQLHANHNATSVVRFWSRLLGVNKKQFYKPTITTAGKNMKRRNYLGTCTIKYFSVELMLQLTGIFEAFANKFGEVPERSNGTRC